MLHDTAQLAAHVSFCGMQYFFFVLPTGASTTISSIIGNYMGEGTKTLLETKKFVKLVHFFILFVWIAYGIIIGSIVENVLVNNFTTTEADKMYFTKIYHIYIYVFFLFECGIQNLSAILRSIGMQNYAILGHFLGYYVFAIPLLYIFMFPFGLGIVGLWQVYTIAGIITVCIYYVKI